MKSSTQSLLGRFWNRLTQPYLTTLKKRRSKRMESAESLEDRILLTTRIFLDLGEGFFSTPLTSTVNGFRNVDGAGTGAGTGSDIVGIGGLVGTDTLNFSPINYDWDNNGTFELADVQALAQAVLEIAVKEAEPLDIEVLLASAASLEDVRTSLHLNDAGGPDFDGFGQNDAYNLIANITSTAIAGSGSVGNAGGLFGIAAGSDLFAQAGNRFDEATLTFSDVVLSTTLGTPGTAQFNSNLAHRIAYTAVHEANHTLTLIHTDGGSGGERLLTRGDAIRLGSDTREDRNIYTNFSLGLQGGGLANTFLKMANDLDIGRRDTDRDGVPDYAYVTGTGAHDLITLTNNGDGTVDVLVQAYNNSTKTSLIRSFNYTINLATDTEGLIVIDGSVNDDTIIIDTDIPANFEVRGHIGSDEVALTGAPVSDVIYDFGTDDQHQIEIVRGATSHFVSFDEELELVTDQLQATDRTFRAMDDNGALTHDYDFSGDFEVTSASARVVYDLPLNNLTFEANALNGLVTINANPFFVAFDVQGDLIVNAQNIAVSGSSTVTSQGTQTYNGAVTTGSNTRFIGSDITFNGTLDGTSFYALVAPTGTLTFNDQVGSIDDFSSFTVGPQGTTHIAGDIFTVFGMSFENDVTFENGVELEAGLGFWDVSFHGKVHLNDNLVTISADLIFVEGSELIVSLDSLTPGPGGHGQFTTTGLINFQTNGVGVALTTLTTPLFTPSVGDEFIIINKIGGGAGATGEFAGIPEGGTFFSNGFSGAVSYIGGGGNDVVLSAAANPPTINLIPTFTNIDENTPIPVDLKVADIVITDDDGLGTNALALSGPDAALFRIVGLELFLIAGTTLDFETKPVLNVTVEVDDATIGNTPDETADLVIMINDVNEIPVLSLQNLIPIPEDLNTTARVVIADVRTLDILGTHAFTITGPDAGLVEIIGNDPANWRLAIRAGAILDFETNPTLDFTITVNDTTIGVDPDDSLVVSLNVIDINEPPTVQLINRTTNLDENVDTTNRIKVADIVVNDDALQSLTGAFNSTIFTPGNLLVVDVTGGTTSLREYTLDGTLVQQIPLTRGHDFVMDSRGILHFMDFVFNQRLRSLNPVTGVQTLTVIPGWNNANVTYYGGVGIYKDYLFSGDQNIGGDGTTGLIRIDLTNPSIFTRTAGPEMFDVTVGKDGRVYGLSQGNASSGGGTRITVYDPETLAQLDSFDLPDVVRAIGVTANGTIYAAEAGGSVRQYSSTGALLNTLNPGLGGISDVDISTDSQTIVFTSSGGNFTVVDAAMTGFTIPTAGTSTRSFATFVQAPVGTGGNQLRLSGADAGLFEIVGNELYLRAGAVLDFETNPVLDVTIEVNDPGVGTTLDATDSLQIAIGDINEAATALTASNVVNPISEGQDLTAAFRVADITIVDDALGTNVLSLTGADAGLFELQGNQLFLRAGAVLDFETNPTLEVTINVEDDTVGVNPDATLNLVFNLTDFNEAASVVLTQVKASVNEFENTTTRIKIADIAIVDDALGTNTLSLSGADASLFEIVGMELFLKAGVLFDFETNPVLDVTVNVDDIGVVGTPDGTASLAVNVIDENDAPGVHLTNLQLTVPESPTPLSTRFKVADIVIDDDALGTNSLRVSGTDRRFFEIDGNALYLIAGTIVDFEKVQRYDVNVEVNDSSVGDEPFDARVKVRLNVVNVNDPPVLVPATFTIPENSLKGTVVGSIPVTDRDPLDTHTFSIAGLGNTNAAFAIDPLTGEITVNNPSALDFETKPTFLLTVSARDNGLPPRTTNVAVTINLTNRAEADAVLWNPVTKTLTIATGKGSNFSFASDSNAWSGFDGQFFLADVNGENGDDIIGVGTDGKIMVGLNNGNGFDAPTQFGAWDPAFVGTDLNVGDFNGDGNADLIARGLDGRWRYQYSRETSFVLQNGHRWGGGFRNGDALVLDYDGDGFDDIALVQASGQWFVGFGSATGEMTTAYVGRWSNRYTWTDLRTGDFNNDGRGDIIARSNLGHWYQLSTIFGTRNHVMTYLDTWNPTVVWNDVTVADFDGDGIDDFAAWNSLGYWFVNKSSGNFTTQTQYGRWNQNASWQVTTADLNGDGADDILGFDQATGNWWALLSHPTQPAITTFFGKTAPAANAQILGGEFI